MKRAYLVVLIAVASALAAPAADAHPVEHFDACAKPRGVSGEPCRNKVEAGEGTRLIFKAVVRPKHRGQHARVWSLRPHADSWTKVGVVGIEDGRMHWQWVPEHGDVYNYTSWRFRFVIPGHGSSDTVKIRVRSADF